jgi:selenocysteine lyase/cysteine desulfurase
MKQYESNIKDYRKSSNDTNVSKNNSLDWQAVRDLFEYDKKFVQLGASQFVVSHPKPVRDAIHKYSSQLDAQPVIYTEKVENENMQKVRDAVSTYFGIPNPDDIAITDSTTMGLGLTYTALNLQKGQEILTTNHDHYSQHESIRQATARSGASYRRIDMYRNLSEVTKEEIVQNTMDAIRDETRVLGVTWVHSSSGLKLPIPEISAALKTINAQRDEHKRVLLLVDGVHGFGIEMETFAELGCDIFISACHKWIYGPRGTGIVAVTRPVWQLMTPVIPSYTDVMDAVIAEEQRPTQIDGKQMTPGGFHSLEYRWALADAFQWIMSLGKETIYDRVHELNRRCKEGLAAMSHVKLHTPISDDLSAGIVSFEVDGLSTQETVQKLQEKKIVATASPYKISWARFTPGIINSEEEVDMALAAVRSLKR